MSPRDPTRGARPQSRVGKTHMPSERGRRCSFFGDVSVVSLGGGGRPIGESWEGRLVGIGHGRLQWKRREGRGGGSTRPAREWLEERLTTAAAPLCATAGTAESSRRVSTASLRRGSWPIGTVHGCVTPAFLLAASDQCPRHGHSAASLGWGGYHDTERVPPSSPSPAPPPRAPNVFGSQSPTAVASVEPLFQGQGHPWARGVSYVVNWKSETRQAWR